MAAVIHGGGDKEDDKRRFAVICPVFAMQPKNYQQGALAPLDLWLEALGKAQLKRIAWAGRLANILSILRRLEPPQREARNIVEPTKGIGGELGGLLLPSKMPKLSTVIPAFQQRPLLTPKCSSLTCVPYGNRRHPSSSTKRNTATRRKMSVPATVPTIRSSSFSSTLSHQIRLIVALT